MNKLTKFIHELFNPHCLHCIEQRDIEFELSRENERCRNCESYERQIAVLLDQNSKLTEKIVNPNPIIGTNINESEARPTNKVINRGRVPFSVIKNSLEAESRAQAQAAKNAAVPDKLETNDENKYDTVEDLEKMVINAADTRTAEVGTKLL